MTNFVAVCDLPEVNCRCLPRLRSEELWRIKRGKHPLHLLSKSRIETSNNEHQDIGRLMGRIEGICPKCTISRHGRDHRHGKILGRMGSFLKSVLLSAAPSPPCLRCRLLRGCYFSVHTNPRVAVRYIAHLTRGYSCCTPSTSAGVDPIYLNLTDHDCIFRKWNKSNLNESTNSKPRRMAGCNVSSSGRSPGLWMTIHSNPAEWLG